MMIKMKYLLAAVIMLLFLPTAGCGKKQDIEAQKKDPFIFRYAHSQSGNHPRSKSMVFFQEQLEKASDGRIKVVLYFSGEQGREEERWALFQERRQGEHSCL